jgi:hypothetical protein
LSIEMRGRGISIQIGENGRESIAAMQNISGGRRSRVHENVERGVLGEERHLSLGIPSIGAMGIGVDQFADRETVGRLLRKVQACGELGLVADLSRSGFQLRDAGSRPSRSFDEASAPSLRGA